MLGLPIFVFTAQNAAFKKHLLSERKMQEVPLFQVDVVFLSNGSK